MSNLVLNSSGSYHGSVEADLITKLGEQEVAFLLLREIVLETASDVLSKCDDVKLREMTRAALLRSVSLIQAILNLGRIPLNEEMWCLVRPLVELSINTAYLQTAGSDELERFLLYDDLKAEELHKQFDWLEEQSGQSHVSYGAGTGERIVREQRAEKARSTGLFDELYRKDKINAWSKADLFVRAQKADSLGVTAAVKLFEILHRSVTKEAHGYIHSNNASLHVYRDVDALGEPNRDLSRMREVQLICSIANAASFSLVSVVRKQLSLHDHLHTQRIISILKSSFPD